MPSHIRTRLIRAGIISTKVLGVIVSVVLVVTLGTVAWNYFGNDTTVNSTTNINGRLVKSAKSVPHTVAGFFAAVVDAWRPNTKAFAMENGRTLEEYAYGLSRGSITGATLYTIAEEPPVDTNGNANVSTDGVLNENVNPLVDDNSNANSPLNDNINAGSNINLNVGVNDNVNLGASVHENVNLPSDSNANAPAGGNTNVGLGISPINNVNRDENVNVPVNTNTPVPTSPEVISRDEWYHAVPAGKAYLKVGWFCSAALTHLSDVTREPDQALGDFTGDCTNRNVSVKGSFIPQELGGFSPAKPLKFRIASEHQQLGSADHRTDEDGLCVVDYIRNAGVVGVYAAQYTCDDGYSFQRTASTNVNGEATLPSAASNNLPLANTNATMVHPDDIQFTVYIFPANWKHPVEPIDLLTTADRNSDEDGDGLTYVEELQSKTNPNNSDTDYDGLGDFEELRKYTTNAVEADSDHDGYKDGAEVAGGYNPLGAGKATAEQLATWAKGPNQPGKTIISGVATSYQDGQLSVSWTVQPMADGIVNWGPNVSYGQHLSDYGFTTSHQITFPLSPGEVVHYAIRSCTPAPHSICTVTPDVVYTAPATLNTNGS